jgi:ATP-dependent DNA helicase RecG
MGAGQQNTPVLSRPVASLYGVGPERAAQLARLEIRTVAELLLHRPRRYEDRRRFKPIAEWPLRESALTRGRVVTLGVKWFAKHTKSVFELVLEDGTARLHCRWWNLPYMEKYFARGDELVVFGKLLSVKPRTVDHPETEIVESGEEEPIHLNRITPIYPLTEGLPQRWLRALIWRTLEHSQLEIPEVWPAEGGGLNLPSTADAVRMLHRPETMEDTEMARRRLAFDEFMALQDHLQRRRRNFERNSRALPCAGDNRLVKPFLARLGFKLTAAQTKVLRELRQDMSGAHPMRRLLQGDVGSGKTVVAACCALMALESGYDVALMAPTEILAEQHFQNFSRWFQLPGVRVELRTGSRKTSGRPEEIRVSIPAVTLVVGTHALIESAFAPQQLGLVIIDEQHKFGVAQRERLLRKGHYPHLLVMTATPIPRTLGLTLYGDLDASVLDQLPPGRGQIKTFVRPADALPRVWAFMRDKLAAGRQAFVVYPRIEETGGSDIKAVKKEFGKVQAALAPFQVGLLHGRMTAEEKQQTMTAFRENRIQALLATSLIEVGVDVPNATLMLIENAESFGLAQLHQLRGRIGRGAHESHCILISGVRDEESALRLKALAASSDGFQIAEADLRLRGPGELLGQEQSGLPSLRFGDLARDYELVCQARLATTRRWKCA